MRTMTNREREARKLTKATAAKEAKPLKAKYSFKLFNNYQEIMALLRRKTSSLTLSTKKGVKQVIKPAKVLFNRGTYNLKKHGKLN